MKILLVGCFDLMMHPYAEKYIEIFRENQIEYNMIYWNRSGEDDNDNHNIPFNFPINTYSSRWSKLLGYYKYRRFVSKIIKSGHYERVVFLATQTMVFFSDIALKLYKGEYIFDYRDETYENNCIYKSIVLKCMKNSYKVVISSPGFKRLFANVPANKYVLCHNTKSTNIQTSMTKCPSSTIRISFWGQVRLPEYFIKLIDVFKNDDRFFVSFFGEGSVGLLKSYVKDNAINNVKFEGKFRQSDILRFASNTDFLINCYSNDSYQKLALTVKMYEAISFEIPMLVQKNSYMETYLKEHEYPVISIDIDGDEDATAIKEKLILYKKDNDTPYKIINQINMDQTLFREIVSAFVRRD